MKNIIGLVISFIIIVCLGIFLGTQNIGIIFKETIEVSNIVELEKCKEGDYISLEVSNAYLTDYSFENARYVDIDVNGQALICVVDNEIASKIENNDFENLKVEGVLKNLSEDEAVKGIKQNYIEDFQWELTEEAVLAMFTDFQLVSYEEQKTNTAVVAVCGILIIGMLALAIFCIIKIRK